MLSALNLGEQGLPCLTRTNVKQPNPWYTFPFSIIHPLYLSLTWRWVELSREEKVNNIQNKSTHGTSPGWHQRVLLQPKGPWTALVFFLFFFCRIVSDVSKRINNEWAALTGHIFHLAEMALMQSACITLPITETLRNCMGEKDVQTIFKERWTQAYLQCKWPSFEQNSWTSFLPAVVCEVRRDKVSSKWKFEYNLEWLASNPRDKKCKYNKMLLLIKKNIH